MYYVAIAYLLYQVQTDLPLDFQGLAGQRRRGNIASMIDRYSNRLKGRKGDRTKFRYLDGYIYNVDQKSVRWNL